VYHILDEIRGTEVASDAYEMLLNWWTYGTPTSPLDELLGAKILFEESIRGKK
jgi:hypothetical protein